MKVVYLINNIFLFISIEIEKIKEKENRVLIDFVLPTNTLTKNP